MGVCAELMRQSGATVNPGASGIFQPCVLFDAYSGFEEKEKTPMDARFLLVVQTFPFTGPVPAAFFFWKGNVRLAPCADVTNALCIRPNEAATHRRLTPPLASCLHPWEVARPFSAHPDVT